MVGSFIFFFKQKTAYEMRISDWSSDVCSSDLIGGNTGIAPHQHASKIDRAKGQHCKDNQLYADGWLNRAEQPHQKSGQPCCCSQPDEKYAGRDDLGDGERSEEHTSELQSLMRISYAVFCLKKKTQKKN